VKDFLISEAAVAEKPTSGLRVLHLEPRRPLENVSFMMLEVHLQSCSIRALTIQEYSGGRNRIEFTNIVENPHLGEALFRFKAPKGAEIVRVNEP
jgi:outer membrane lipoprotein-sorting protein